MPPARETRGRPWAVLALVITVVLLSCAATLLALSDESDVAGELGVLTGLGTLLLAVAVVLIFRGDRRLRSTLERAAVRDRAMVTLSDRLSLANTSADVLALIASETSEMLGATNTRVAVYSPTDRSLLLVRRGTRRTAGTIDDVLPLASPAPLSTAVRTGDTITTVDRSDADVGYSWVTGPAVGGDALSRIALPLEFRSGERAGAIEFGWQERGRLADDDLAAVALVAELTARSYERAVTAELVQAGASRLRDLTQTLAAAVSAAEVIDVVRRMVPPILGARHALVIVAADTRPGSLLRLDHGLEEFSEEIVGQFRSIEQSDDVPSAQAFATDRIILMENREQYLADYPHLAGVLDHMEIVAGAHVPVHDPSGVPVAVMSIAWSFPVAFHATIRAVLTTIALAVGETLARAALYDQEHELIVELQAALLAPVPHVDGLEIAVRYEPAISVVGIGGDWYDAVLTASGRFVAIIGDVTGHGAHAVAMMAQVQAVIVHLVRIDTPATEVLEHASTMLAMAGSYATAQIVEIDTVNHTLRYVNAGHPFPMVRRSDGSVEILREGCRPLLGIDSIQYSEGVAAFNPGDHLLLYTDGLIERRDRPIDQQIESLAELLSDSSAVCVTEALDRMVIAARAPTAEGGAAIDDDLAAVLIRRPLPPG